VRRSTSDAVRLRPLALELGKKLAQGTPRARSGLAELPEPLAALHEVGEDARAARRAGAAGAGLAPAWFTYSASNTTWIRW
jgi:hypothetical protein